MKQTYLILIVFLCLLTSFSFGAGLSAEQGIEKIISEHDSKGITYSQLFEDYRGAQFVSQEEWMRFLKKLVRQDQVTITSDYPELCFLIGKRFQEGQRHQEAYYFLYITLQEEENVYASKKPYLANFHDALGQEYFYFRRYDLATKHLLISLHHPSLNDIGKITVYNTLGLIYRDKLETEKAEWYTQKAYDQAIKLKHKSWIGILSGNLGYLLLVKKEYRKARELIQFDFETSKHTKETGSEINALRYLIQLDIMDNKLDDAKAKIQLLEKLISKNAFPEFLIGLYDSKTRYYDRIGNYKEALESYKKFVEQKEIVNRKKHFLNIANAEFQIEFERKQGENNIYKEKKKTDDLIILGLFVICLILGLTSFIIIKQIQRKRKQDKELLTLRAQKMEDELQATEREMRALLSTMFDKNKEIFELQEQVESFEKNQHSRTDSEKEAMLNDLQSFSLLTENDWIEFKRLFEKLNPGFFDFFQEKFPEITAAEIRLAALIKLNLSNLEMARTLAISPDSVRKTNLRLRKKLNIESLDDLTRFIKSI